MNGAKSFVKHVLWEIISKKNFWFQKRSLEKVFNTKFEGLNDPIQGHNTDAL